MQEGGVRVPGFITGGMVPESNEGFLYAGMMHVVDIMSTILGRAGIHLPGIDGKDHWDVWLV
jgi:arylsulfatase A-like enzyme